MEATAINAMQSSSVGSGAGIGLAAGNSGLDFSQLLMNLLTGFRPDMRCIQYDETAALTEETVLPEGILSLADEQISDQLTDEPLADQSVADSLQSLMMNQVLMQAQSINAEIDGENSDSEFYTEPLPDVMRAAGQSAVKMQAVQADQMAGKAEENMINLSANNVQFADDDVRIKNEVGKLLEQIDAAYQISTSASENGFDETGTAAAAKKSALKNPTEQGSVQAALTEQTEYRNEKTAFVSGEAPASDGDTADETAPEADLDAFDLRSADRETSSTMSVNSETRQDLGGGMKIRTGGIQNMDDVKTLISRQAVQLKDNSKASMTITLKPEELGKMTIQLELSDGVLNGKILVDNDIAKSALAQQIETIKAQIRSQGINLDSLEVNIGNNFHQQFQDQQNARYFESAYRPAYRNAYEDESAESQAAPDDRTGMKGKLNLLA